jgi:hypothetical protein
VWLNLGWLLATGLVVVAALAVSAIRLMPHPVMSALGVPCTAWSGCVTPLPVWAQWGIWSGSVALLAGLLLLGGHSALSGTRAMARTRRATLSVGREMEGEPLLSRLSFPRLTVLDGSSTFAFTVGLLRPAIVLSADLIRDLDTGELEAVVAHESAHVAGRDNLILLTARTIARSLWFVPGVRLAHRRLRRAVELAADNRARGQVGDGLVVASSLHRFALLISSRPAGGPKAPDPVLAWFSDDGLIVERIGRLLDEPDRAASRLRIRLAFGLLAVVLVVFALGGYRVANADLNPGSPASVCTSAAHAPGPVS